MTLHNFSPNRACSMRFWRLTIVRLVTVKPACRILPPAKNVAKTLEISTFTKIMLLWLQFGGPPINAAAATATLFSQTLIKHVKY